MNKSALKAFATSARKELLKKVEAKAMKIGITEDNIKKAEIESSDAIYIDGKQLSKEEKIQRDRLIDRIDQIGFKQVMEEVSYTWFNRFTALRYMEVNEYLPTDVRVLSSTNPESADPDMINEALSLDLEIDKEYVYELKLNNKTEELFKHLIIKHCNDLNRYLPFMFETIDDYTEILFPEGLLARDTFIREMTNTNVIPEDNWKKVEVIGWLYQYYIAEEKDRVIKAKKKYKTEEIPFATQLFTPDWIVRYMVQNSLGRYWIESHPEHKDLLRNWEFYLENPNSEPDFEEKLAPYINKELKVEDIKCFDPAMGSGHILVYMFDVLYEIYNKCGYMEREIPRLIIENNLYGLDIDDRAYQLACFSVVMKALKYNSRFFISIEREGLILNLASIQETNILNNDDIAYIAGETHGSRYNNVKEFIEKYRNAKTIGSLIKIDSYDMELLEERLKTVKSNPANNFFEEESRKKTLELMPNLIKQSNIITKQYDVLVTNPPYMNSKYMNNELNDYIKSNFPNTKSDIYSTFMVRFMEKVKPYGHLGFLTPYIWMFISSFEKLRKHIVTQKSITSLVQLEYNAFPEATVPVCSFTLRNYNTNLSGEYIRLSDFKGIEIQSKKTLEAVENPKINYRFSFETLRFKEVPGYRIAYWINDSIIKTFNNANSIDNFSDYTGAQHKTANNEKYLRYLWEVDRRHIGKDRKWVLFVKGGEYRKWYGNIDRVVDWSEDARQFYKSNKTSNLLNEKYWYKEGITYTELTTRGLNCRYMPEGGVFSIAGPGIVEVENLNYFIGLLNSKVGDNFLSIFNPTFHANVQDIKSIPILFPDNITTLEQIEGIVEENIRISKNEWDNSETSMEFKSHPFIYYRNLYTKLDEVCRERIKVSNEQFIKLKNNEEILNKMFINLYHFNEVLKPEISDKDVTIEVPDKLTEIKSFISYAIGCIFGRYSLDREGLIFSGGKLEQGNYHSIEVDRDNIIPILSGSYFEDDIVTKFITFIKVTFSDDTLSYNLDFIADTLGRKKGETAKETIRRYFLNEFFKDHVQTYKNRPIYWFFTSGKEKAFNCLINMHRYDKTTLSRIRTDYLHEYQIRLDAERKSHINIIEGDSTTKEISNAKKELKVLDKKIEELKEYDELLHHMADMQIELDLDNGVSVNYEKFKGLVARI
jgi:N-6 DNA Methylase